MLKYYKNEKIHVIQMERQCRNQDELLKKGRANDPDLFGEGRGSFVLLTQKNFGESEKRFPLVQWYAGTRDKSYQKSEKHMFLNVFFLFHS